MWFQKTVQIPTVTKTSYWAWNNSITSDWGIVWKTAITSSGDTMTLPAVAWLFNWRSVIIQDTSGNAGTDFITIATPWSETIDGKTEILIETDNGSVTIICDWTNFFTSSV